MHLVTSSLFLPSLSTLLSRASQTRLLRAYFSIALAHYVARGRPPLPFAAFFAAPAPELAVPGPHPTPSKSALHPDPDTPEHAANAWAPLAQSAAFHPDAHVPKLVRALAHWAERFGARPEGYFAALGKGAMGEDGLDGVEKLDGSVFVRAAALSLGRVGWVREGEEARFWD
jgi:hypothetical protein